MITNKIEQRGTQRPAFGSSAIVVLRCCLSLCASLRRWCLFSPTSMHRLLFSSISRQFKQPQIHRNQTRTMSNKGHIHFFDYMSKTVDDKVPSWSPNTNKTRLALNYKQIPYTESFISTPDIPVICASFGIPKDAATKHATLPAIIHYGADGQVIKALGNSLDIAHYLDSVWPDKPVIPVVPGYSKLFDSVYSSFFTNVMIQAVWGPGWRIPIPNVPAILDDRGAEVFVRSRTAMSKARIGRTAPPQEWGSPNPEDDWKPFLDNLKPIVRALKNSSSAGPFLFGETPTHMDFELVGIFAWFKRTKEANFHRLITSTPGGEFERLWKACEGWLSGRGKLLEWDVEGKELKKLRAKL